MLSRVRGKYDALEPSSVMGAHAGAAFANGTRDGRGAALSYPGVRGGFGA